MTTKALSPTPPAVPPVSVSRRSRRRNRLKTKNGPKSSTADHDDKVLEATIAAYYNTDDSNRRSVLNHIETILSDWSMALATDKNPWQRPRPALISFGSYRLGVHTESSDLDVLCLAPPHCSRGEFFTSLVQRLQQDSKISRVHPIPSAYTPVIKFYVNDSLAIDLLFARVSNPAKLVSYHHQQEARVSPPLVGVGTLTPSTRKEYLIDDTDLTEQDEAGVRSLNGARVSQILLTIVPNLETYRIVLKAVKEWAVVNGIYSNVLGFLGGVNWAILVAWVCLRHPQESSPSTLLRIFFQTFAIWEWPTPVLLTPIQETPPSATVVPMPAWNPQTNPRDGLHLMPIITPAYPSMNSSYNVGIPQLRRIQDEMIRACNLLDSNNKSDYKALFEPSDFFCRHEHFLEINIRALNKQDFIEWFRLVESRLRLLICALETPQVHAWPFCRFFERKYNQQGMYTTKSSSSTPDCRQESCFYIALRFAPTTDSIHLRHLVLDFLQKVNAWEHRQAGMDLSLAHVMQHDLPSFVFGNNKKNNDNGSAEVPPMQPEGFASPTKKCRITTT